MKHVKAFAAAALLAYAGASGAQGLAASEAAGREMIGQIEAKWSKVMRGLGWTDESLRQFKGYAQSPEDVLREALDAPTFEGMQSVFSAYAALAAREAMAKAYPSRKEFRLGATAPDASEQVLEAKRLAAKALGEDARDLVFIPITPCTVWDTRFAGSSPYGPAIGNGMTRQFWSHYDGGGSDFSAFGGNPSCTEANENFIGGRPFAAMMIVYVNNPQGQGWLTFYRDGDPDPSQATISVYYSPGPTRTQTVVAKSNRGYGGAIYDIAVTGRFSTADASASVVGYFVKPGATPLQCQATILNVGIANGARDFMTVTCPAGYTVTGGGVLSGSNNDQTVQASAPVGNNGWFVSMVNNSGATRNYSFYAHCCRVPGR